MCFRFGMQKQKSDRVRLIIDFSCHTSILDYDFRQNDTASNWGFYPDQLKARTLFRVFNFLQFSQTQLTLSVKTSQIFH